MTCIILKPFADGTMDFNHAHEQAIKALRYLADNDRPAGGEQFPNSLACHQIADDLERSFNSMKLAAVVESKLKLPCDVTLHPATVIKEGCSLATLLLAIMNRHNTPDSLKDVDVDALKALRPDSCVKINGREIDLNVSGQSSGRTHRTSTLNGIDTKKQYLVKIGGQWFLGRFNLQWYGHNFGLWLNGVGLQYDAPGTNNSQWERVIEINLEVV